MHRSKNLSTLDNIWFFTEPYSLIQDSGRFSYLNSFAVSEHTVPEQEEQSMPEKDQPNWEAWIAAAALIYQILRDFLWSSIWKSTISIGGRVQANQWDAHTGSLPRGCRPWAGHLICQAFPTCGTLRSGCSICLLFGEWKSRALFGKTPFFPILPTINPNYKNDHTSHRR